MKRKQPETLAALRRRARRMLTRYERMSPHAGVLAAEQARASGVRVALRWVLYQTPVPTQLLAKWLRPYREDSGDE